jgi:hypothetical protein
MIVDRECLCDSSNCADIILMDLPPVWVPVWNGDKLPAFEALRDVEIDDLVPNPQDDLPWAFQTLDSQLSSVPEARPEIWETVLALWRLGYLSRRLEAQNEKFQDLWQQYTSAWLVSDYTRISCRVVLRQTFQVPASRGLSKSQPNPFPGGQGFRRLDARKQKSTTFHGPIVQFPIQASASGSKH